MFHIALGRGECLQSLHGNRLSTLLTHAVAAGFDSGKRLAHTPKILKPAADFGIVENADHACEHRVLAIGRFTRHHGELFALGALPGCVNLTPQLPFSLVQNAGEVRQIVLRHAGTGHRFTDL
jgi:hypothetical protein